MIEEPVIGGDRGAEAEGEEQEEPIIGEPADEPADGDGGSGDLAVLLRETLLATHDDLSSGGPRRGERRGGAGALRGRPRPP